MSPDVPLPLDVPVFTASMCNSINAGVGDTSSPSNTMVVLLLSSVFESLNTELNVLFDHKTSCAAGRVIVYFPPDNAHVAEPVIAAVTAVAMAAESSALDKVPTLKELSPLELYLVQTIQQP